MDIEADMTTVKAIRNSLIKKQQLWDFSKHDPQVVFLGTGSMKPSTYRNVSGIFIQFDKDFSVILDCGEGTYYQLLNHVGVDNIDEVLMNIKIIFITHVHSDHNLGILNMIARKKYLCDKRGIKNDLYLIVPYNMAPWIHAYN
jgi:ribonuclease Z